MIDINKINEILGTYRDFLKDTINNSNNLDDIKKSIIIINYMWDENTYNNALNNYLLSCKQLVSLFRNDNFFIQYREQILNSNILNTIRETFIINNDSIEDHTKMNVTEKENLIDVFYFMENKDVINFGETVGGEIKDMIYRHKILKDITIAMFHEKYLKTVVETSDFIEDYMRFIGMKFTDVNYRNSKNNTIFMLTYKNNDFINMLFDYFIRTGKTYQNDINVNKETLLSLAAKNNNISLMEKILAMTNNNIDILDIDGKNSLFYAIDNRNTEAVKLLLEKGADIYVTSHSDTPLSYAVKRGYVSIVKTIIENYKINDTELFYNNKLRNEAVLKSTILGYLKNTHLINDYLEIFRLLLTTDKEFDTDTLHKRKLGSTTLINVLIENEQFGFFNMLEKTIYKNNINKQALIQWIDKKDLQNTNALMIATKHGKERIVKWLLELGANANITNDNNDTPLMTACKYGYKGIVYYLLKYNAEINTQNTTENRTALIYTVARKADPENTIQIVRLLMNNPSLDINIMDIYGKTALIYCLERKYVELYELLNNTIDIDDTQGLTLYNKNKQLVQNKMNTSTIRNNYIKMAKEHNGLMNLDSEVYTKTILNAGVNIYNKIFDKKVDFYE